MKITKQIWLALAAVIAILPMLVSCTQTESNPPAYSTQPSTAYSSEPKHSPSPAQTLQDDFGNRPVYDNTNRSKYDIQVIFDESSHSATASQTVTYTNTAADSLSELYMHIYPNHFSKQKYVDMTFGGPEEAVYPDNEFNPGYITVQSVEAAGVSAAFKVQGDDETILRIPLETPLPKGSSIKLSLEYSLQVPHRIGRYAWGETGTSFGNWYPIMAVYDDEGWNLDKYYEIGDPFYSETADYNVTIDIPAGMKAAHTGDVVSDTVSDGRRILSLSETGVRDFAFVLSSNYIIESKNVDGIEVRVAIPAEHEELVDDVIDYATKSLELYNKKFGRYTNDVLTVAFSDFSTGMEYPGIVLIGAGYLLKNDADSLFNIERVVSHEIAHQWWYSAVGNNEIDEAWLDEGLTNFTGMIYFSDKYGWNALSDYLNWTEPEDGDILEKPLDAFSGWDDYTFVYRFGQRFFKALMDKMGEAEFYGMLQKYYAAYAYEIATADDLRTLVAETGNEEALDLYDKCVYGK